MLVFSGRMQLNTNYSTEAVDVDLYVGARVSLGRCSLRIGSNPFNLNYGIRQCLLVESVSVLL